MAEIKSIAIKDINIGERLREIEEDHAQAIAASIREVGLLSPIVVRPTPAAKGGKFTLVAGAHRLRAIQIIGLDDIDAMVVKADGRQAQLLEINENLFRNELSVIDRALFVQKYRELWEDENGEINAKGGRPKNSAKLAEFSERVFSKHVADRLGVSKRTAERLDSLARHLHPDLKKVLRGTPVADNQSALLKLAKMDPAKQRQAAIGWRATSDLKQVFKLLQDTPVTPSNDAEKILSKLVDLWERATPQVRSAFLSHIDDSKAEAA